MKVLVKFYKLTMGSFGLRKYLTGGILAFVFGVCLVTQLAVTIFEHMRRSSAVNIGVLKAFEEDIVAMTFSVPELYSIKYGMQDKNAVECHSNVKYVVIILTSAENTEFRDNMRRMWSDFELVIDVATKNSSKMVPPKHQIFFLVHSLEYQSNDILRNVINESIFHRDIFYIQNGYNYNVSSMAANDSYDFSSAIRGLIFANTLCKEVSHIIVNTDTALLHVRNAVSMLDHKGKFSFFS